MTTQTHGLTVRKSITVRAGRERAFTVFTEKFFTCVRSRSGFTEEAPGLTRVELTHRHIERHDAPEQVSTGVGAEGGWGGILADYAKAVA